MKKTIQKFLFTGVLVLFISSFAQQSFAQSSVNEAHLVLIEKVQDVSSAEAINRLTEYVKSAKKDMTQHSASSSEYAYSQTAYNMSWSIYTDLQKGESLSNSLQNHFNFSSKFESATGLGETVLMEILGSLKGSNQ